MSTVIEREPQVTAQDEIPPFPVRRWTLEEYQRLRDSGMFDEERVELIEGWIVPKMTKNPLHDSTIMVLDDMLRPELPASMWLRVQSAVTVGRSEPEPDLTIVRKVAHKYRHNHPGEGDIEMVIEVADSSLPKDRRKSTTYAEAGIPIYWIVNFPERQLEVFEGPLRDASRYASSRIFGTGTSIAVRLEDRNFEIAVDDIFEADE